MQIWSIDRRGDRSLTLRHQQHNRKPLGDSTEEVLKHLHRLWGFDIHLETVQGDQVMKTHHMPPRGDQSEAGEYGRMDRQWSTTSRAPSVAVDRVSCRQSRRFFMQIYKVGGAVRDRLLGRPVSDIDWLVVGATVDQMQALGYRPVGADFPVFIHPRTGEEYALARTERKSGRGYGGFTFHASPDVTLEEDLIRRDLTINAMAEDELGNLYDPYHGKKDLDQRLLRHVSPAFAEDPLRVLRVARFAARYAPLGFRVADETRELMRRISASGELQALTAERSWKEIERALMEDQPQVFIRCCATAAP